jgi:hypothetical protein
MTELRDLWDEYGKIIQGGKRTTRALKIEEEIHILQKNIGTSRYDFDKRWEKNAEMGTSTLSIASMDDEEKPTVPSTNFTFEQAKSRIGENDFALLEDCAMRAEAEMVVLARIFDSLNIDNQRNVARRGQAINIAVRKFEDLKSG